MTAPKVIHIKPDANLPAWLLFQDDGTGRALDASGSSYVVKVRTPYLTATITGTMTASSLATLDNGLSTDVPTFRFAASVGACASFDRPSRAQILVYVGAGNVARYEYPARVVT